MKSCPKCQALHQKRGIFCSRHCANSRVWTEEERLKKSLACKNSPKVQAANALRKLPYKEKICSCCKIILDYSRRHKKTCGKQECVKFAKDYNFRKTCQVNKKCGGARENSGRSYSGYYSGFYCGSTYELAFLIWNLDNGISVSRCDKIFEYGGGRKYYPDFEIDGKIFEIKGFHTESVSVKEAAVTKSGIEYEILYKSDLDPMIQYVKEKYKVKNLYDLYDKEIIPRYTYICITCGAEIKTQKKRKTQYVFCGYKCIRTQKFLNKNSDVTKLV